jgi:predicted Zn-dependent protease
MFSYRLLCYACPVFAPLPVSSGIIQFDAAAAALEPLVAAHPQCVEAVRLLGCVYAMSVAADADSNTNGALNASAAASVGAAGANVLKPHQKAERAKALLKRSLAVHASDADAWLRLGEVCAATDPTAAYQVWIEWRWDDIGM